MNGSYLLEVCTEHLENWRFAKLYRRDPKMLSRSLTKIFGVFPEAGTRSRPGSALHCFRKSGAGLDRCIIRQLVLRHLIDAARPTSLQAYERCNYRLTRKGLQEILDHSSDIAAQDILANLSRSTSLDCSQNNYLRGTV